MLDKLIKKAVGHLTEKKVDPWSFNDPVAVKTEWTPLSRSGSNFRTHKLVTVDSKRLEFRSTFGMKLFSLIFFFAGTGMIFYFFYKFFPFNQPDFEIKDCLLLLIGVIFSGAGVYLIYESIRSCVFDKREGYFWKRNIPIDENSNNQRNKEFCKLEDIHALQTISEYCRGNKSSYYSYELNVVLKDGQRLNVEDHGNDSWVIRDANKLAKFLNVPVWNAI